MINRVLAEPVGEIRAKKTRKWRIVVRISQLIGLRSTFLAGSTGHNLCGSLEARPSITLDRIRLSAFKQVDNLRSYIACPNTVNLLIPARRSCRGLPAQIPAPSSAPYPGCLCRDDECACIRRNTPPGTPFQCPESEIRRISTGTGVVIPAQEAVSQLIAI